MNETTGACGIFNLDSFDDFKMHVNDIRPVKTGEEFIRSWILDQDIEACQSGPVRNHVYGNNAMTKCTNMFASSTVFNTTCSDYVDYGLSSAKKGVTMKIFVILPKALC